MKQLANEIVAWLKDYAVTNKRPSFTLGVSGGVDSALVSTLCGMTGLPTHCVILPCQTKDDETLRGNVHIAWLKARFPNVVKHRLDLTDTFESFQRETELDYSNDLGYANAKSRLRMIALYHIATCTGGLVVGTGNRVEDYGVFFYTKGGDGMVDIAPIGDLMKSEVRQMCRELGVLPELSEAVPTDGLWENARTDEQQLGATYDELEWAWNWRFTTATESPSLLPPRQQEVLSIYDKWHNAGLHKSLPIPTFRRKM